MKLRSKIQERLDALEIALHEGKHLSVDSDQKEVEVLITSISKFYSILSDEDRDFLSAAKIAASEKASWA